MKRSIIVLALAAAAAIVSACGIYSFSGTSIQPDVNSITIDFFEYKALRVNPSLSNDLTEALRTQFRKMTKLEQVDMDGDLEISGEITGYEVKATAVTADEVAAQNRLTITVKVNFQNRKYPDDDFENKSFSAYEDYDSTLSLDSVESSLCQEIITKLIDDIFNATVAQW
jgi:outer membrane lipopolysaccharide assembly protein LptE/RlpB